MNKTMEKGTTSEYVQENWEYFGRTWRGVGAAIKHYERNPGDLQTEVVGVNAFKDRRRGEDKDVSSARISTTPTPNRPFAGIIRRVQDLAGVGTDVEDIQLQIGAVPTLSDVPGDRLAISSIQSLCHVAQPIWSSLVKGTKN